MSRTIRSLTGQKFGRLTVVALSHVEQRAYWQCLCECGNAVIMNSGDLTNGHTKSCGCLGRENRIKMAHFAYEARRLPFLHVKKLGNVLKHMRGRCLNVTHPNWPAYGGRGISICEEWLRDRKAFYAWANENGYRPGLSIDRRNNDGNYEPENCRWADRTTQANNTRRNKFVEYDGERLTVSQWAKKFGVPRDIIRGRLHKGLSITGEPQ